MKTSKIKNIYIHPNPDLTLHIAEVNRFYIGVLERYLNASALSKEDKAELINRLIIAYQ